MTYPVLGFQIFGKDNNGDEYVDLKKEKEGKCMRSSLSRKDFVSRKDVRNEGKDCPVESVTMYLETLPSSNVLFLKPLPKKFQMQTMLGSAQNMS